MKKLLLLSACLVLNNCFTEVCRFRFYASQFDYKVNISDTTDGGIQVDTSNQDIDLDKIDRLTIEVEACLEEEFGNPPLIPRDVMLAGDCISDSFALPFHRECFDVKVPNDWVISCDGTQQLLPALAPQQGCLDKGFEADQNCPCRWRGGLQNSNTVVTTPSMIIYKDPLIRFGTGCNNPWNHARLSKCARVNK